MIHRTFLAALFAIAASSASAQAKAHYAQQEIDLGSIQWHSAAVANIQLTNKGNKPLYITKVDTDCGCTVVSWNHSAIAPGASTTITATYNAETLGTFGRYVTITTSDDTEPQEILLTGRVLTEVIDYSAFAYKVDNVHLSTDVLEFDDVNLGDHPEQTILVYNNGQKSYAPEFMHLPKYLSAVAQPEVLRPGRVGKVTFILDSEQLPTMGLTQAKIYVSRFPGDKVRRDSEIDVSATLLPQFDLTDRQLQMSPVAVIPTSIDLGVGVSKKKLKGSLTLENHGAGVLHVNALQVYNPGISVSLSKSTLKPGEKATLRVTASAAAENFKGRRRILLITDDPTNSKITIDVTAKKINLPFGSWMSRTIGFRGFKR